MMQMRTHNDLFRCAVSREERRLLAPDAAFRETARMNDVTKWKVPKWPFLLGEILLLGFAYLIVWSSPHPIAQWEIIACFAAAFLGALIGCLPFIFDYRATGKIIEINALESVAEKIKNLEKLAGQINSATNEWTEAQTQAEKTSAGAKEIADKMAAEVRAFSDFMQRMNDSEKSSLRLESEKLRRAEGENLQVIVRILDHVFLLHSAAVRSGQQRLIDQITNFQLACRDAARRIGLTPFISEPGEPFNAERNQIVDGKKPATENPLVAETVGAGYTFQGKLLRPALVRLRENDETTEENPVAISEAVANEAKTD